MTTVPSASPSNKLPGWLGLGAAALLLLSPFVMGFTGAAVGSAFILGLLALGVKLKPMIRAGSRDRWIIAAAGTLIVVAPWLLGFADAAMATWTHVLLGAVLVATASSPLPFRMTPRSGGSDPSDKPEGPAEAS